MDFIDLPPLLSAQGVVQLPGSKSISNRVLLLSALAGGVTEVRDLLESDDTARMLDALRALGIAVESLGDRVYRIHGVAKLSVQTRGVVSRKCRNSVPFFDRSVGAGRRALHVDRRGADA